MISNSKKILITDDDPLILKIFNRYCAHTNFHCMMAKNGCEAISILNTEPIDGLITDINMPDMNGYALIDYCHQHFPQLPILVMSGDILDETLPSLQMPQIKSILTKPVNFAEIFTFFM